MQYITQMHALDKTHATVTKSWHVTPIDRVLHLVVLRNKNHTYYVLVEMKHVIGVHLSYFRRTHSRAHRQLFDPRQQVTRLPKSKTNLHLAYAVL